MHNRPRVDFVLHIIDSLLLPQARNDYNLLMSGEKTVLVETLCARLEETKKPGGHQLILHELYQLDMLVPCI